MSPFPTWKPGDRIADRFSLVEELGVGGMGAVWRATQLNLGRDLALKLLLPEYAASPGARARFEREARVASALKHPNAVQIYDFGEDDGQLFIAMELLEGVTLRSIVDEHLPPQPLERTLRILSQIAEVLLVAHEMHLVHRDLKPENVFLERTPQGQERVVVVDFGLAFIRGRKDSGRLTREGVAMGTPDYMSPEQAAGDDDVGSPADVYSLGCILYEMLTTQVPFRGNSVQVITQQLFSAPTPPSEARKDLRIPRELEELCLRMLSKRAAERPAMDVVHGLLSHLDPSAEKRERGRDGVFLEGRAARMISTVRPAKNARTLSDPYATPDGVEPVQLAVVGELAGELGLGLGANGLIAFIVSPDQPIDGADAIFAPGAEKEALEALAAHGVPLVTDAETGDMGRVTELLRAGVDEVVHRPIRAEDLSKKVWRAIRRHRRRKTG